MRTLQQELSRLDGKGGVGASLRKHLSAAGITEWEDITKAALFELRDHLAEAVAPGTAKTVVAHFKALLNRNEEELELPKGWRKVLAVKATRPMKTYLNENDLDKLERVVVHTNRQKFVKNVFLVCAYTGLRVSDAMNLTLENIDGEVLRFAAQKTKKAGCIPLKSGLKERIGWVAAHPEYRVTLAGYNTAIRKMCKDAGITEEVVVFKGGKELKGPKWQFISSHSARISTASCLNKRGVPLGDICALLQHSSPLQTNNYIVRDRVELSPKAMAFFN